MLQFQLQSICDTYEPQIGIYFKTQFPNIYFYYNLSYDM